MRVSQFAAVGVLAVVVAAGCSSSPNLGNGLGTNCSGTFDLEERTEALGSSVALEQVVRTKSAQPEPVSLGELTAAAQWSDDWDRMVVVYEGTRRDRLNARSELPDYCWLHLWDFNWDARDHVEYYVFIQGTTPKQSVRSYSGRNLFGLLGDVEVLRPDTVLEPKAPRPGQLGFFRPASTGS